VGGGSSPGGTSPRAVYSVSGEEHVWCSSDVRVLIAGDSNVHRLKSACPPNARIDFLPVSGE
jgi:hypothetical protein